MELKRQMGFASYQTAWTWLHKIRRAMVRPGREPLREQIEADETYLRGTELGKRGRAAGGKTVVAGAVGRGRHLGRLRLAAPADAYGPETVQLVGAAGFARACTSSHGLVWPDRDRFLLSRIVIGDWDGATFKRRLQAEFLP
jgi:hypothetical protein